MARPPWRLLLMVSMVLVCGIMLGYRLACCDETDLLLPDGNAHFPHSQGGAEKGDSNLGTSAHRSQVTGALVQAGAVDGGGRNATSQSGESLSCRRLWQKGRSAWFDQRFDNTLLPVWLKKNAKLSDEVARWWTGLQSSKNSDYRTELRKTFEVIPSPDHFLVRNNSACLRCAVVGNSGNLRGSGYGALIDDHDAVIRINRAKTKGFEKDVGRKESYRMMYPESFMDIPADTHFVLLNFKVMDVQWARSAVTTGEIKKTYTSVKSKIKVPPSKILFYNPSLMWHIHRVWIDRKGRYPSSGSLAVFFALQFCDEVSVFGMGANRKGFWDHYWQAGDGSGNSAFLKTHVHDSVHELEVIEHLAREEIITLYKGVR